MIPLSLLTVVVWTLALEPAKAPIAEAPVATQPAQAEAEPPLTREQALAAVAELRSAYQQARTEALQAYLGEIEALKPATPQDGEALQTLAAAIRQQMADLAANRHVQKAAEPQGLSPQFAAPVAAAEACQRKFESAQETYLDALRATLARDEQGFIGQSMIENLAASTDTDLMWVLCDFYWHHQMLDVPAGSYERIIQLGKRYVELEPSGPDAATTYCNTAWLLWSRWVTWKQDPQRMPLGEGGDEAAITLLLQGRSANPDDAAYHLNAAMTVWGLAASHQKRYFAFIIDSLKLAQQKASSPGQRLRATLTLGHAYRKAGDLQEARKCYQQVLELEPGNSVATSSLQELDEAGKDEAEPVAP